MGSGCPRKTRASATNAAKKPKNEPHPLDISQRPAAIANRYVTVGRFDIHEATGNPRLFFSNAETRAGFIEPLLVFIPVDCCAPPHGAAFHRFIDAGDFHVRTAN